MRYVVQRSRRLRPRTCRLKPVASYLYLNCMVAFLSVTFIETFAPRYSGQLAVSWPELMP